VRGCSPSSLRRSTARQLQHRRRGLEPCLRASRGLLRRKRARLDAAPLLLAAMVAAWSTRPPGSISSAVWRAIIHARTVATGRCGRAGSATLRRRCSASSSCRRFRLSCSGFRFSSRAATPHLASNHSSCWGRGLVARTRGRIAGDAQFARLQARRFPAGTSVRPWPVALQPPSQLLLRVARLGRLRALRARRACGLARTHRASRNLFLLLRVTGVPPTEAQALRSKGDAYRRYQQTTSAFFPWFPRITVSTASTAHPTKTSP